MSAVITVLPAGWYEDDMVPGRERWWDGDRWTDRVRRTDFGLDCWDSEHHRAATAGSPAAHRGDGGRWTDEGSDPAAATTIVASRRAGPGAGLAAATAGDPLDAWDRAAAEIAEIAEIGPRRATAADSPFVHWLSASGIGVAADHWTTPVLDRAPEPDPAPVVPAASVIATEIVATEIVTTEDPAAEDEPAATVPPATDRMTGRPLADAAAVMAALAALSAPIEEATEAAPARPERAPSGATAPASPTPSWSSSATANAVERAAARAAAVNDSPRASETEWVRDTAGGAGNGTDATTDDRARRRSAPPRPTIAPNGDAAGGPTSHTFTKIDREALDAAMALSTMLSPSSGGRPPAPTVPAKPVATPAAGATPTPGAPVAPVAPTVEERQASEARAAAMRKDRPPRPAPPVPRWSDQQPADDEESDTGFVRIASRDRQKRVLGK